MSEPVYAYFKALWPDDLGHPFGPILVDDPEEVCEFLGEWNQARAYADDEEYVDGWARFAGCDYNYGTVAFEELRKRCRQLGIAYICGDEGSPGMGWGAGDIEWRPDWEHERFRPLYGDTYCLPQEAFNAMVVKHGGDLQALLNNLNLFFEITDWGDLVPVKFNLFPDQPQVAFEEADYL